MIASRITSLQPSPTLALDAKVKKLKQQGIAVINLGLGEPDFDTPKNIREAAIRSINEGFTHYTQTEGILPLRQAIAKKFLADNYIQYDPSEIIVGNGSKQLLYSLFQVLCENGDEVLIPLPTWSTYIEQIKLAGGEPIFIKLQSPFKVTAEDIKKNLSPKTKVLLLNSPSNPTGAMIDEGELKKIAHLAVANNIIVISDEIYEKIIYGAKHISIASLNDDIKKRTITVNGVSKAYAMTGWRLGFAGGPKEIITVLGSLQSQLTSNASSISQMAALEAISGDQKPVETMRSEFEKRRHFVMHSLSEIPGLSFSPPDGAFYFFISIEKLLHSRYATSAAWCEGLLEKEKIAVVPGEAFGYPGYFRLSCASSMEYLEKGVKGITKFIKTC
jgi:aspartate aminotransferase